MPANLNAEQLALLRQLAAQLGPYQGDTSSGFGDGSSYSTGQNQSKWSSWDPSQAIKSYGVQMGPNGPVFAGDTGDGTGYVYDQNGNFVRAEDRNDGHVGLINGFLTTAALGSLASGLGAEGAATGGGTGSGVGTGAGSSWLSAVPAENAAAINAVGQTAGTVGSNAALLPTWQVGAGTAALGAGAAGSGGAGAGGAGGAGGASATGGGVLDAAKAAVTPALNALTSGNGSTLGGLLGAGLGALSSKDQTTSSTKDPWAPAQDFIKQQIAQGQSLSNQYQARPFSDAQKTAYGNLASIINGVNANAPNMSDFINRQMSGGTAYDPRDPYKNIGKGVSQIVGPGPSGLLNYFPGKGG